MRWAQQNAALIGEMSISLFITRRSKFDVEQRGLHIHKALVV